MTINSNHFNELSFYTLSHTDSNYFIHQLIVDAYTAQNADENTKTISLVFAVVGLYLLIEKGYTGRQIQEAHITLSKHKEFLPEIELPTKRGGITIINVLDNETNRDDMIKQWCAAVWEVYKPSKEVIEKYCKEYLLT